MAGQWEGDLFSDHTCLDCMNIRDGLSCNGTVIHEAMRGVLQSTVEQWRDWAKGAEVLNVERTQSDVSPQPTEANAVPAIQEEQR